MSIFCQKKRPFSKKHCALMYFFSFFYEKPPVLMTIFSPKNVNYVISTLYYAKKAIGYRYFSIFYETNTAHPIFVKNVHSLKTCCSYALILSNKTSILSKTLCSQVILFLFFHKKPPVVMSVCGPKT